ncbi:probable serine/threonine-protein kinase abkC isoform X1 [Macadamia integrifolia]|uniref:probable serine/threonine-protein kinase abkC isoform X1 n=2 Tax=Macadamia integrifolia TaxID=60698 RepID=UPI001C5290AB|nr:probable serine/threonine-protein kinase abkC isoform X1 [Macadamia integrifolia]
MSRLFSHGTIRAVAHFLLVNQRTSFAEIKKHGIFFIPVLPSSMIRSYSQCSFSSQGHVLFKLFKMKENLYKSGYSKNFSFVSASDNMTHHAQIAWKRLSQICSYRGSAFPPISRIACAVSLALARSHLVAPSILAFIIGEVAWTRRTWADAEYFPQGNNLYNHAQAGNVYLTSFVFSILEGLILVVRLIYLAILFSPATVMAPFADWFSGRFRKTWLQLVHRTLEMAGPAFIKWGQWAATRPDLFPSDLCTELAKLHSKVPAHSFAYTKRTIEKAFGRKLPEIFENFEEEPVASGSIAQVHRACLRFCYPGEQVKPIVVAVKVRHPGVGEIIRRDFVIINVIAKISNFIPTLKWLRLDESVQQFAVFMMSQVDLAREAAHLNRFIYNFRSWKDVSFPKPLYPLVHPAVLVETYEQGQSISYYVDELEGNNRIKSALSHIGSHALLKMLLVDNFLHADMHPGNILVRVAPSKSLRKPKPHVIFLDVGMTTELSKSDRENLLEFFKAVVLRDGRTAAERTLRLSKKQKCPNPKVFIEVKYIVVTPH